LAVWRPGWDIQLIGSGPLDPSLWALPNVHVLGRKSRAELSELYRAADALILPSVGEGFPLVVQEAMASGLPVFCGLDSAAADPNARNMLHGIEVVPGDPAGTAKRFAQALDILPAGVDLASAEHARRTYDWDRNAAWIERRLSQPTA
jgi:glycosyltransferase involved in cell wall biosynthesis